jgi:hypothetical protein
MNRRKMSAGLGPCLTGSRAWVGRTARRHASTYAGPAAIWLSCVKMRRRCWRSPDVVLCHSNPALAQLQPLAANTPIVFVMVADPVGSGFVQSLARPGGNITGFTHFEPQMGGKWVQILKDIAPGIDRVAGLMHPQTAAHLRRSA